MTRLASFLLAVALAALVAGVTALAQDAPTLTDIQRLTLQNHVLTFQLAQARLEAAIKELSIEGFELDLATLRYVKKTETGP